MTAPALGPDTDRRLVELAIARGLADSETVRAVAQERGQRLARGERPRALAQILCDRGLMDRKTALALLKEVRDEHRTLRVHETVDGRPGHVVAPRPAEPAPPALAPAPPLGAERPLARIAHFELEGELGRGGMGVVYRAVDTLLGRPVALKVVRDSAGADKDDLERFKREAKAIARLDHPGIVKVYETGEHEGKLFIAMELVPGESFEALLKRGPLPPKRTAEIVRGVALALSHAHSHGVVHRDMKPANVLIDGGGAPHVLDFGLARDVAMTQLTRTGDVLGTPAYMAPEQANGVPGEQGPATDIHALGAVLYRALAGRLPFEAENAQALLYKVLTEEPVPPRRVNPAVHQDLETITLRCMAKEPARRYGSAAQVAEELRRFLGGDPIVARPVGLSERAVRWARRHRLAIGSGILALVVALVAATGWRVSEQKRRQRAQDKVESALGKGSRGDLEGAIEDANDAIELEPGEGVRVAGLWLGRALARFRKGDFDGAIADTTKAIELDPKYAAAWANRAGARANKHDFEGAIADATKAIELNPTSALSWGNRAGARGAKGDFDGEIADARKAMEIDPRFVGAWLEVAQASLEKGDLDEAIRNATRANELDPKLASALGIRAGARLARGDLEGALADAERQLELAPAVAVAWEARARVREKKGDLAGAIADYTRSLELEPTGGRSGEVRAALDRLQQPR